MMFENNTSDRHECSCDIATQVMGAGCAKDYSLNARATCVPVAVVIHTLKWTRTFDGDKSTSLYILFWNEYIHRSV